MTDTTNNFDPIPRLQQIAAAIMGRGACTFDSPATAAYYIECAIKEIERLRRMAQQAADRIEKLEQRERAVKAAIDAIKEEPRE